MLRAFIVGLAVAAIPGIATASSDDILTGEQLRSELGSHTTEGFYTGDKVHFVEIYLTGGRLTYKADNAADTGDWSIKGDTFCTMYDHIGGECWYVVKRSSKCFQFYPASSVGSDPVIGDFTKLEPSAKAARDAGPVNCEPWYGS